MEIPGPIKRLQLEQRAHDQQFHPDIFYMPYPDRMRHFVFHFAKYTGRVAAMSRHPDQRMLRQTLADTFIVCLAASDVLNIDFDHELSRRHGDVRVGSMPEWNEHFTGATSALLTSEPESVVQTWMNVLAMNTGQMAKAMESLDHMEAVDARTLLSDGLIGILSSCITLAHALAVDLEKITRDRWDAVARRRVL